MKSDSELLKILSENGEFFECNKSDVDMIDVSGGRKGYLAHLYLNSGEVKTFNFPTKNQAFEVMKSWDESYFDTHANDHGY